MYKHMISVVLLCGFTVSLAWASFKVGVTHTQYTADYGDSSAISRAQQLLAEGIPYQNQHIMGFGALNPEPSPGQYSWGSLDTRINLIRSTGAVPVITLCCAPDWMKGGTAGQTDWSKIEVAPLPQYYEAFANLTLEVAKRYSDVQHFQVWNEFKGFWSSQKNRWNYEGYTQLYNFIYDKLKAFNSSIQIGGPYVTMDTYNSTLKSFWSNLKGPWGAVDQRVLDVIKYWLQNARGAQFITIDAGIGTKDDGLVVDPLIAVQKFSAINRWIRNQTELPIWWAEYYVTSEGWSWEKQQQVVIEFFKQMVESNGSVALQWPPMGTPDWKTQGYLWNDSRVATGGYPTLVYEVVKSLNKGTLFPATPSIVGTPNPLTSPPTVNTPFKVAPPVSTPSILQSPQPNILSSGVLKEIGYTTIGSSILLALL